MADIKYSKENESVSLINTEHVKNPIEQSGLNIVTTCVFIVGVIAGSGFLTLPKAIDETGWIGFILIPGMCLLTTYTGNLLGECWTMVRDIHPEFKSGKIRYPYPAIGEVAYGRFGRYVVSFSINFTMFGMTVVYVLLSAENIVTMLPENTQFNVCYVSLIVGAAMTPLTWLGTPKDFWGIAAAATFATSAASLVMLVAVIYYGSDVNEVTHTGGSFVSFFSAYGLICNAFNGHPAFPTFQSDMKEPAKFGKALLLGYLITFLIYMPSASAAYFVYGDKVQDNILNTLPRGTAITIISVLMSAHLLFGIIIVLNPVSQELEHVLNIPEKFTWKRLISRTLMMCFVLFIVESVPHFSSILSLVGGSTITILAFICPPLFYIKLYESRSSCNTSVPLHKKVFMYEIVFIGLVAGIAATYSAIMDLAVNKFTVPCYVDPNKAWQNT